MTASTPETTFELRNVRVFDGKALTAPRSVFVDDGMIVSNSAGGEVIDGAGRALLPGFIDAHIHLNAPDNLQDFAKWGVTTGLDMGTNPRSLVDSMRHVDGLTDIRSALSPASGPGGLQTTMNVFAPSTVVHGPDDAARFIAERVVEGCDFVKIIIEDPEEKGAAALSAETIAALVTAAHLAKFLTIAHASSGAAVQLGIDAGVDVLTHVPLRTPVTPEQIAEIRDRGVAVVPTLVMMAGIAAKFGMPAVGPGIQTAQASVAALHAAGVHIIAGTDANNAPFVPFSPKLGESLHDELALLVGSGFTPAQALRSATLESALLFGLTDRGEIAPGKRADLVLIDADPTIDITATRRLRAVWVQGVHV